MDIVERLPTTNNKQCLLQYNAIVNRRERLKNLFADNPDRLSSEFKLKFDEITKDYNIELRKLFQS